MNMDITKEALTAIGLSDDQADKVVQAHADSINGKFIPKSRFDEVNEQLKDVRGQVTERDTQIAGLKRFQGSADELKAKVTALQEANTKASEEYASKLASVQKAYAVRSAIGTDAQDPDLLLKLIDMDSVSITGEGKALGVSEQIDALRKDRPYLFKDKAAEGAEGTDGTDGAGKGGVRGFRPPESAITAAAGSKQFDAEKFGSKLAESRNAGVAAAQASSSYYFHDGAAAPAAASAGERK
jgi:hypothetical protein